MKNIAKLKKYNILFFIVIFLMIIGSGKPSISGSDSKFRFNALHYYVTGDLLDEATTFKYNSSLGILASPLYFLGHAVKGSKTGAALTKHLTTSVAHFNHLLLFGFLIWFFKFSKRRFLFSDLQGYFAVLIVLYTSMLLPHTRDFYSEMLWSFCALYTIDILSYCFFPDENSTYTAPKLIIASTSLVWFSTALTPIYAGTVGCMYLFFIKKGLNKKITTKSIIQNITHKGVIYSALGTTLGIIIYFSENYLKRGNILDNGYLKEPFIFEPINYLYLLLSPGKGVFMFMPALILIFVLIFNKNLKATINKNHYIVFVAWYAFFTGLVTLYGSWDAWGGAGYWGPRFFLMPSIFSSIILSHLIINYKLLTKASKVLIGFIFLFSFFINRTGVTIVQRYFDECKFNTYEQCHLTWVESPFYVFTKEPAEWLLLIKHQSNIALLVGILLISFVVRSRSKFLKNNSSK